MPGTPLSLLRNPLADEMMTGRPGERLGRRNELGPIPNRDDRHRVRDLRKGKPGGSGRAGAKEVTA